jgi:acetylornithine/succinyldiaminopimelate/putrescine aminotransferase
VEAAIVLQTARRMSASASEKRYLGMSETPGVQVSRTEGCFLFDAKGRKYIDFVMGWCVGNFGWGNPEIVRAAQRYRGPDYIYPEYSYKPWGELARMLASLAPGNLKKCFRATGGSEAVELALQAALLHTGRRKFLSLEDSYHGNTLGTLSIGASENRKKYKNLLPNCHKIDTPLDSSALGKIETQLKGRDVAAFIMEPISINLGVLIPDRSFMTGLQRLCKRYGTLLVMDEVACGFGRTGKVFASEHFGLEPDIICLGKAITGGIAALGAMITTEEIGESLEEDGNIWSTFGWHPRSVAVAIATLRYLSRNKKKLLDNVDQMSLYLVERLLVMDFKKTPSLCVKGLAIGVDLHDEDYASRVEEKCRRNGLLVVSQDESVLLLPALTIDRAVARRAMDILEASI